MAAANFADPSGHGYGDGEADGQGQDGFRPPHA
jgi:hypothetical protein